MISEDPANAGHGDLSPEVERFLTPRATPPLRTAVLSATTAGAVASLAGLLVLVYYEQSGIGGFVLAARVAALKMIGSPPFVESSAGLAAILLAGWAYGIAAGALFGVVIAKLIGKVGAVSAVGVGVIYGLLIWCIEQFVVLSSIAPNAVALTDQHVMLTAHVVYGALLGILGGWSREPQLHTTTFALRHHWG